ncbi:MAG: SDR family NAD(P)-dependent oxidoreductase [Candidatus Caenarcaniphilales bacterium]|nr:SDR family NAD(P)-dependent oxidoreductase [Candidatus Caenarcaniphilales bacterium]
MTSLKDRIILITGASSGIGAATAKRLSLLGAKLILLARRAERLEILAQNLSTESLTLALDICDKEKLQIELKKLPSRWKSIYALINNAGLSLGLNTIQDGDLTDWESMIDTNLKGLLYITREILPGMIARNEGHIINLGSIAGYETYPRGNVYCSSKAAVHALSRGMKLDLLGTKIRVTLIAPGLVETEFSEVRFKGDRQKAKEVYSGLIPLTGEDIAETIAFALTCPPNINVSEMTVFPVAQASAVHNYRQAS